MLEKEVFEEPIDKENLKFNSRAFMIRFCEEEVELNDIGHFRVEIDTDCSNTDGSSLSNSALHGNDVQNFNQTEMMLEVENRVRSVPEILPMVFYY